MEFVLLALAVAWFFGSSDRIASPGRAAVRAGVGQGAQAARSAATGSWNAASAGRAGRAAARRQAWAGQGRWGSMKERSATAFGGLGRLAAGGFSLAWIGLTAAAAGVTEGVREGRSDWRHFREVHAQDRGQPIRTAVNEWWNRRRGEQGRCNWTTDSWLGIHRRCGRTTVPDRYLCAEHLHTWESMGEPDRGVDGTYGDGITDEEAKRRWWAFERTDSTPVDEYLDRLAGEKAGSSTTPETSNEWDGWNYNPAPWAPGPGHTGEYDCRLCHVMLTDGRCANQEASSPSNCWLCDSPLVDDDCRDESCPQAANYDPSKDPEVQVAEFRADVERAVNNSLGRDDVQPEYPTGEPGADAASWSPDREETTPAAEGEGNTIDTKENSVANAQLDIPNLAALAKIAEHLVQAAEEMAHLKGLAETSKGLPDALTFDGGKLVTPAVQALAESAPDPNTLIAWIEAAVQLRSAVTATQQGLEGAENLEVKGHTSQLLSTGA